MPVDTEVEVEVKTSLDIPVVEEPVEAPPEPEPTIRLVGAGLSGGLDLKIPDGDGPVTLGELLNHNGLRIRSGSTYRQGGDILSTNSPVKPDEALYVGQRSTAG